MTDEWEIKSQYDLIKQYHEKYLNEKKSKQ